VIGHAAINGIAGVSTLALAGSPPVLLGPVTTGIIGWVGFVVVRWRYFLR
jgi:hypothetical protein